MNPIKHTGARTPWGQLEIRAVISVYEYFLIEQRADRKYQKADKVRKIAADIGRTKGSVEAKLMNISHVRQAAGRDFVTGYKPLANCQGLLVDLVHTVMGDMPPKGEK